MARVDFAGMLRTIVTGDLLPENSVRIFEVKD
jgi:hypothetical protein